MLPSGKIQRTAPIPIKNAPSRTRPRFTKRGYYINESPQSSDCEEEPQTTSNIEEQESQSTSTFTDVDLTTSQEEHVSAAGVKDEQRSLCQQVEGVAVAVAVVTKDEQRRGIDLKRIFGRISGRGDRKRTDSEGSEVEKAEVAEEWQNRKGSDSPWRTLLNWGGKGGGSRGTETEANVPVAQLEPNDGGTTSTSRSGMPRADKTQRERKIPKF